MDIREAIANNKTVSKVITNVWKASPTIAVVIGATGSAASLYLMWRAARKHDEVVEEIATDLEAAHATPDAPDYKKRLIKTYINAGFKLSKLYAPAVATEAASIWLMGYGYSTLHERYTNTLAMVTVAEKAFSDYRKNVVDILGEDADKQFRYGLHDKDIEVPELDKDGNPKTDKNGAVKTKTVREKVLDDELEGYSGYARIFSKDTTKQFDGDMATGYYNREFLMKQQSYWNMMLKYRPNHTVFLNEVYDSLGFERTQEGQVVGWHYDPDYPVGDNEIKFVPIEFYNERYEAKSVILDFNVDGNVWTFL